MKLLEEDIAALDNRKRVLFINSLSGFKSANIVATADNQQNSNLAIVSSVVHIGANPPLLAMVMRPHTVPRGTIENILNTEVYTLNHVNKDIYRQSHQTSARYPEDVSEFDEVGLTEQWNEGFGAPFVKESQIKIGMKFREQHSLEINGTSLVIGEIVSIEMPDDLVADDGFVSLEKAGTVAISSLDTYHSTNTLASLSYAKPDKFAHSLPRDSALGSGLDSSIVDTRAASKVIPKCVLVVGASGGIGQAFCEHILKVNPSIRLIRMTRDASQLKALDGNVNGIQVDLSDDASIDDALAALPTDINIDWLFIASGWLHDEKTKPEKTYRNLNRDHLLHSYNINAVGPALFVSQLLQKLDKNQTMKIGVLSARVGSVSDNRLGGWHSYRSSKSALHMLIKNIAIECKNARKNITIVGLQPGTTDTNLSAPFQKGLTEEQLQTPEFTAEHLFEVMSVLEPTDSGKLFDFAGLPFEP